MAARRPAFAVAVRGDSACEDQQRRREGKEPNESEYHGHDSIVHQIGIPLHSQL